MQNSSAFDLCVFGFQPHLGPPSCSLYYYVCVLLAAFFPVFDYHQSHDRSLQTWTIFIPSLLKTAFFGEKMEHTSEKLS